MLTEVPPPPTSHVSGVMCHVTHVTCHMSRVINFFFIFFGKGGEVSRWRVCHQRGLPRLVFKRILASRIFTIVGFSIESILEDLILQSTPMLVFTTFSGRTG